MEGLAKAFVLPLPCFLRPSLSGLWDAYLEKLLALFYIKISIHSMGKYLEDWYLEGV